MPLHVTISHFPVVIIRPGNTPEAGRRSYKFVNELGVPFFVKSNHETRLVTCSEERFLLVVLNLLNATLNKIGNVLFCCVLHATNLLSALYVLNAANCCATFGSTCCTTC